MEQYTDLLKKADLAIEEKKEQVSNHYWRLNFHVEPQAGWMNDPNGLVFYKGDYHLFFQHYPYSAKWGPMHWGHYKSVDLVHWVPLPIALAPSEWYDINGCFSGSAIEKDGKLYLLYTGNVWTGENHDTEQKQYQAVAISEDGVHFEKFKGNPVMEVPQDGNINQAHFRDPKVWEHQGLYYCVVGSKTRENKGQVLLFRSNDLISWDFVNIMAKAKGNMGFMWECPDLFSLGGKDILMMSPQGLNPEGINYRNLHQSGYLIGELNYENGQFTHGDFHQLDVGFDFYAPQSLLDDKGRRILVAWMEMWESKMPTQDYQWAGSMTIPRLLQLKGDKIVTTPVPELKLLREDEQSFYNITGEKTFELDGVSGDSLELEIIIEPKEATHFGINLRYNKDFNEKTVIEYDCEQQLLTLNREQSGKGEGGVRQTKVELINQELHLQVFVDRSSVEVFINHGEKVMTARVYPREDSKGIQFFSDGKINLKHLKKWQLKSSK